MSKLTQAARGEPCLIRLPVCNSNPETTCACHFRVMGISGIGMKVPDFLIAFGCSACHAYVDSHHDAETQLAFSEGVFRTQNLLIKRGLVKWGRAA